MTPPPVVLLDLDGTLVDCSRSIVEATLRTAEDLGLPAPTPEWARERIGHPPLQTWELLGATDPAAASARFGHFVQPIMNEQLVLLPGVPGALRALHEAGLTLAVATTRKTESAKESLRVAGLTPWIAQVTGRDLVERPKPAPDVLLHALEAVGGRPERAIMVGDSSADVLAAHALGMPCFGLPEGIGGEQQLREAGADLILSSGMSELPEAVRGSALMEDAPA